MSVAPPSAKFCSASSGFKAEPKVPAPSATDVELRHEKAFKCDFVVDGVICKESFSTAAGLLEHTRQSHKQILVNSLYNSCVITNVCPVCGSALSDKRTACTTCNEQ